MFLFTAALKWWFLRRATIQNVLDETNMVTMNITPTKNPVGLGIHLIVHSQVSALVSNY